MLVQWTDMDVCVWRHDVDELVGVGDWVWHSRFVASNRISNAMTHFQTLQHKAHAGIFRIGHSKRKTVFMTPKALPFNSSRNQIPQMQQGLFRENWDEFSLLGNTLMSLQECCRSVSFKHLLQHTVGAANTACVLNTNQNCVCVFVNDSSSESWRRETEREKFFRKKLKAKALKWECARSCWINCCKMWQSKQKKQSLK